MEETVWAEKAPEKIRIAIIEDDEAVREVCRRALSRRSHEVVEFSDGASALEASKKEAFDIAIVDWVLPDYDGFSLFQRLKERSPNLVGIALTGQSMRDVVVKSLGVGMLWVLIKPFTIAELISVVDTACNYVSIVNSANQLRARTEVAETLLREVDLERLGEHLTQIAIEQTCSNAASLLVADRLRGCLRIVAAVGIPLTTRNIEVKPTAGIVGLVIQMRKPIVINSEMVKHAYIAQRLRYGGRGSAISFPLVEDEDVNGILNVTRWEDEPQFKESDVEAFKWFIAWTTKVVSRSLQYEMLKESFFNTARLLISLQEAQDPYRRSHSERVAEYACALASFVGCSQREIETVKASAFLYQIGLHLIDKSILHKKGKLTEAEYEQVKRYPELTIQALGDVPFIWDVREIILAHREHYDGSGYPHGRGGEEIPFLARLLSVADTYVALTSPRPHRPAMSEESAKEELLKMAGKELDPELTKTFVKHILEGLKRREAL